MACTKKEACGRRSTKQASATQRGAISLGHADWYASSHECRIIKCGCWKRTWPAILQDLHLYTKKGISVEMSIPSSQIRKFTNQD